MKRINFMIRIHLNFGNLEQFFVNILKQSHFWKFLKYGVRKFSTTHSVWVPLKLQKMSIKAKVTNLFNVENYSKNCIYLSRSIVINFSLFQQKCYFRDYFSLFRITKYRISKFAKKSRNILFTIQIFFIII